MPELDPVVQDIEANAAEYLAALDDIIAKTEEAAAAVRALEEAIAGLDLGAAEAALNLHNAATEATDLRTALAGMAAATAPADAALGGLDGKLDELIALGGRTVSELHDIRDAMAGVALAAAAMGASTTAAADAGTVAGTRWWMLGMTIGQAVHWIVMGTLEIAATAIPALVALTAAGAAMAPTFAHIADQINYLRTATGSWSGVLANSVGPLQAMGAAGLQLRAAVAPDAYVIFGAAINAITSHVGAFSQVAQQASNVLAQFATKISQELSGPMGGQLLSFFGNAVRFMTQWGQVLGNLGHVFVNVMGAMFGVSHVLLAVLVQISGALVQLTSNPIVAWLIGFAAALSAVYRYGQLLKTLFNVLMPTTLINGIKTLIPEIVAWGSALLSVRSAEDAVAFGELAMEAGGLGLAGVILGVIAGLATWALVSERTQSSTEKLITSINKLPPTTGNLNAGMLEMSQNLNSLATQFGPLDKNVSSAYQNFGRFGTSVDQANLPLAQNAHAVDESITEYDKLVHELINLDTGLGETGMRTGQVGAAMQAMAVQTGIADSKVQQVNQAIDQYIGLLTGGTSALAGFVTGLAQMGQIAGTTATATGAATNGMTLSAGQFAKALDTMNTKGAAAWTNLNQVINGNMAPMADWLRQAQTLGAVTGPQFSKAMLDMAASIIPYVKGNTTAQNSLLGFMAAQGLTYSSFGKLQQAAGSNAGAMSNLTGIVDGASNAMSNLSQMAKNAASALSSQVSAGIAKAALASTSYNTDLLKLQHDMANHQPASVIEADSQKIAGDVQTAGQRAITAGNDINQGMTHGGAGAQAALAKAQALQNFINSMHGKTIDINVNTNYATYGTPSASYTGAGGAGFVGHGLASGGPIGGVGTKTSDSNLIRASRGEFMMSAAAVDHYGRHVMEAMNARRMASGGAVEGPRPVSPSVLTIAGGGGGMTALTLNHNTTLKLDNTVVANQQRKEVLTYYRRNTGNNLALRTR